MHAKYGFRVTSYLTSNNVQLGASYPIGQLSTKTYTQGYAAAAAYMNTDSSSIVIGPSTTQLFRNLSQALYTHVTPGSEIVISSLDHEANIASWVQLAKHRSAEVKWWRPSSPTTNPHLDPSDLRGLMSDKTKLVTCTHTSNILGTISPIRAIADVVHSFPSALFVVDAVAYAPHRQVDVAALGADFYSFSWYKVYGPHIAVLYGSERGRAQMESLGHFFKTGRSMEDLLGLAAGSYELIAALPSVVQYVSDLSGHNTNGSSSDGQSDKEATRRSLTTAFDKIAAHEERLQEIIISYLTSSPHGAQITIYGEPVADRAKRVPVISFRVAGWKSQALVLAVQEASRGKFGFRWGGFYSNRLVTGVLGIEDVDDGVTRVSLCHYNTEEEVREWVGFLDGVLRKMPGGNDTQAPDGARKLNQQSD